MGTPTGSAPATPVSPAHASRHTRASRTSTVIAVPTIITNGLKKRTVSDKAVYWQLNRQATPTWCA